MARRRDCGSLFAEPGEMGNFEMRRSTIGRVVLGLVGGLLIGYLLSRGVYVGSVTMLNSASGLLVYEKRCHYFSLNGVRDVHINAGLDEQDAQRAFCPLLGN